MHFLKRRLRKLIIPAAVGLGAFSSVAFCLNASWAADSSPSETSNPSPSASTSPTGPVTTLRIGNLPHIKDGHDIVLPVDSYRASPSAQNAVLKAEFSYTKECAAKYGVDFNVRTPTAEANPARSDYYRLFGLTDLAAAQKYGYHPAGTQQDAQAGGASATSDDVSNGPDYDSVISGAPSGTRVDGQVLPDGGCIGAARLKVGDTPSDADSIEAAVSYGLEQSDRDARVVNGFASWSACMKTSGYNFSTPMAANNDPTWATPTASAAEIATATADVRCKLQTDLSSLRVAVASAWITKYIAAHNSTFSSMAARSASRLANAQTISGK